MNDLQEVLNQKTVMDGLLARYGVTFGILQNGTMNNRLFPYDPIPRRIPESEYKQIEAGLKQRVDALNAFLRDIYGPKRIVKDGIVPEDFVFMSAQYMAECEGIMPPKGIYSHISGIDLVRAKTGEWVILEDNLRVPSGASYPFIARILTRRAFPELFQKEKIRDNRNYGKMLRSAMDWVNTGGINVVMTPGPFNSAYFDHAYLAEQSGAVLCTGQDLFVENQKVYYRSEKGPVRVGAMYRRINDEFLDPLCFDPTSLIGIPNLMDAYRAGNIAIMNTPGNGVADDKGIYYFVPRMIRYYLAQEPILHNAPTYLPCFEEDRKYVTENLEKLVIKEANEAGGFGVKFGRDLTHAGLDNLREDIIAHPRKYIAQEIVEFEDLPIVDRGTIYERKADLRAFVVSGKTTEVWPCGLTRYTTKPGSYVVNSSQGGGFKDTWIVEDDGEKEEQAK